ncbi:MAG TPA: GntR family transcriptional regulator [Acidimicrobiales bacterium]|jgi:DNA-binding GntR family transcriptional regulator|nr:GntR family transcriptional regulator [Acidimicrobiales bacterium]
MSQADAAPEPMTGSAAIPSSPGAVVRKGSGEQAAAYIRQLIFDGQLQEGMRLAQDDVAKAVGVSRIPIREAIIALEREGWVTTKLHRGTFVNAFDEHVIRDHYELFGLVYGLAARRAGQRSSPEIVAHLTDLSKQIGETDDLVRIGELALAFHSAVVGAAHSPRITVVLRAMSALVPGPFFALVPRAVDSERKGVRAIVRAIRDGDGDRAAREYSKMLNKQAELVVDLFRDRRGLLQAV